ncbi:MAG: formyl transferase [Gammaproteobacteria bacterium]|nr:formyl transferase [Gammaproteobacteria bacterium]
MNIVVLIANGARHHHFALTIMEAFPDENVLVAVEPKGNRPRRLATQRWASSGRVVSARNRLMNQIFKSDRTRFSQERSATISRYFEWATAQFEEVVGDRIVATTQKGESINDTPYVERLAKCAPDIIAVMGTGLIGRRIIELPRLAAINQHAGLSPYYRGGGTNMWPIVNGEPQYCGVTVHRLTTGVDAGPIIHHGLPVIEHDDNAHSINCKALLIGARLTVKAIRDVMEGRGVAVPQWRRGRLYNNRDINAWQYRRYHRAVDSGVIRNHVDRLQDGVVRFPERLLLYPELDAEQYLPVGTGAKAL